jgi:hypothetical protein
MYTIYHIPGVKVGCTKQDPAYRVKKQGYTEFEILEVHEDILVATQREIELQLELFGVRDNKPYTGTIAAGKVSQLPHNNAKRMKPKVNKENYFGPKSEEHANNIRKARLGIPHSEERKQKIKEAHLRNSAKRKQLV